MTKLIVAFRDFASAPKETSLNRSFLLAVLSRIFASDRKYNIVRTVYIYIYIVRFGNNSAIRCPYSAADQLLSSVETVTSLRELLLFLCFIDIFYLPFILSVWWNFLHCILSYILLFFSVPNTKVCFSF